MKVKLIVNRSVCNYDYYIDNGYENGQEVNVEYMGKDFRSGNLYIFGDAPLLLEPNIDFISCND